MSKNIGQIYKIYRQGKVKIDKDLNIMNVLVRLRFLQSCLMDLMKKEEIWKAYYNDQNVIDIDCSNILEQDECSHDNLDFTEKQKSTEFA